MTIDRAKISLFPDEILEHIAGIISETRTGSEITRFFEAAGYSEFVHKGKNPLDFNKAHDHVRQTDPYKTIHYLAFASLLMTRIDESIRTVK